MRKYLFAFTIIFAATILFLTLHGEVSAEASTCSRRFDCWSCHCGEFEMNPPPPLPQLCSMPHPGDPNCLPPAQSYQWANIDSLFYDYSCRMSDTACGVGIDCKRVSTPVSGYCGEQWVSTFIFICCYTSS
jgi:hypothetical protein